MICSYCGTESKKFRAIIPKERYGFVNMWCTKCSMSKLTTSTTTTNALPCTYQPNSDEGEES